MRLSYNMKNTCFNAKIHGRVGRETFWKTSVFSVFVSPPRCNVPGNGPAYPGRWKERTHLYKMFRRNDVALKAAPGRDHISCILFGVKTNNDFWTRPIHYPYYIDCTFVCLVHVFHPASADLYYFNVFVYILLLLSLLLIIVIIIALRRHSDETSGSYCLHAVNTTHFRPSAT